MVKNYFLVFSDDFGEHPSSCQHIFRYLQDDNLILWINTIGMRLPQCTFVDIKKAILKSKKMVKGFFNGFKNPLNAKSHVHVFQPPMLPFSSIPGIRTVNKFLVCLLVKKRLGNLKMKSPILVITAPNACDFIGLFGERRTIYYCVDDFAEWPGLNKELVQSMEENLIEKSDIFIVTSQTLFDKLSKHDKQVHLLTHGVDYDFFKNVPVFEHHLLEKIPKPRVGYFGLFDQRSDKNLILELAKRMPKISFVITGNIEVDISDFRKRNNVYFTGSIPYNELSAMAAGWDACMLPYKLNKLTDAIQPLKIKEYLATGKPIISTPIKEACRLQDYIMIAETVDRWEKNIRICIKGILPEEYNKRMLFLQNESWDRKAEEFLNICIGDI